jgi:hypothetical protein
MREVERLRTELLACYNVLPGIEKLEKLPDLILSGTMSDPVHAFTLMQANEIKRLEDRSNRLEEVGDTLAEIIGPPNYPMWAEITHCDKAYLEWQAAKGLPHA